MKTWTLRLGLSLMVTIGFWTNRLPAQTVTTLTTGEQVLVVPTVPYEPAHHFPPMFSVTPPEMPRPAAHHLQQMMNRHGMGCQSNWNWGACGNGAFDFHFIFGSCRSFFGETCFPMPGHHSGYYGDKRWSR